MTSPDHQASAHQAARTRFEALRDDLIAVKPAGGTALSRGLRSRLARAVRLVPSSPVVSRAHALAEEACLVFLRDLDWADDESLAQARQAALDALDRLDSAAADAAA